MSEQTAALRAELAALLTKYNVCIVIGQAESGIGTHDTLKVVDRNGDCCFLETDRGCLTAEDCR